MNAGGPTAATGRIAPATMAALIMEGLATDVLIMEGLAMAVLTMDVRATIGPAGRTGR
jgi:hypothetical protein